MKLHLKKSTTIVSLCLAFLGLFVVAGLFAFSSHTASAQSEGGRLITVHDRGTTTAFVTNKATLREALSEHNIQLATKDAVEPSADEKLVAPDYQVNIYRARPVTVVDGATREKIVTPYQSAERIAKDAGISLYPEDKTELTQSTDIVSDGAGLQLTIIRATPITLDLYGTPTPIRTQAKTVGDMLKEKNIQLGASGRVSVPLSTPITKDMQVRIWREGKQTITVDEDVAFDTKQIEDADQPVGYKQVQTPGVAGKRTVTYEIEVQNGTEVARTEIASITTQNPVTQVVVVGTKVNLPAGSHEDWMAAAGIAVSDYGYVNYIVMHEGSWEPCKVQGGAVNCAYAGGLGYGVVQSTPGNKMASAGSDWRTNPITQLRWANSYAVGRYGSWQAAYNFWTAHRHW